MFVFVFISAAYPPPRKFKHRVYIAYQLLAFAKRNVLG